ncbi:MAG: hypothetical protein RBT04_08080 [Sphaerochaetaceae bacterium]|jgi:hypothetical protein|nr:hypothetical protein [Sphaerochaetaceae bacterium]
MISKRMKKGYLSSYEFSVPQGMDFSTPASNQFANSLVVTLRFVFISVLLKLLFVLAIVLQTLSFY